MATPSFRLPTHASRMPEWIAPALVSAALAFLILFEAAHALVVLSGGTAATPAASAPPLQRQGPQYPRHLDISKIIAVHLFGVAESVGASADPSGAPPTSANLVLAGVIATHDPKRGVAIILADGASKLYSVGLDVGGGILRSVYSDHIVLERGGAFESLTFPRCVLSGQRGHNDTAAAYARAPRPAQGQAGGGTKAFGDLVRIGGSVADPGGKLLGFRIYPRGDRAAFAGLGLRGGELVTAVNGKPLQDENQDSGQQAFDAIRGAGSVTLTVESFGVARDVTIDLNQADADMGAAPQS